MVFEFRNLGIIESADIELKGLTIITGLNDTGKSFIGKTIFSIIKTINESKEQALTEKFEKLNEPINQIFSLHRQLIPFTSERVQKFHPNELTRHIYNSGLGNAPSLEIERLVVDYRDRVIADIVDNVTNQASIPQRNVFIDRIRQNSETILALLKDDGGDDAKQFRSFFDRIIIQKLFQGQINSANKKDSVLSIKIKEGASELLSVTVKDNKTSSFRLENILFIDDATLIETPIIIQLAKFITTTLAFPATFKKLFTQRSDLPYTFYDLLEKMNISGNITSEYLEIFNEIKKIIRGELTYQLDDRSFVYTKDDGSIIKSFNIATGIKSFGLIQLLISSGSINQHTILVIDEPEVHLHPKWEIEYAKIIVLLSKLGIPIVISSHSPYFLQAITRYIKEFQTEKLTKVYFGEKIENKNTTSFKDVTDDLEPIFKALSKPMQDIYLN